MPELPHQIVADLLDFASGAKSWEELRAWLELHESELRRVLDPSDIGDLSVFPEVAIFRVLARQENSVFPHDFGLIVDPIELNPHFSEVLKAAEEEAERKLAGVDKNMGFCHRFWETKKRILCNRASGRKEFTRSWIRKNSAAWA